LQERRYRWGRQVRREEEEEEELICDHKYASMWRRA